MGLSLLAPLFLAGLAAIAVPIYVHLTHRERREPVRFPSLMFLRRIPFRTTKKQRIRHWGLFVLRVLALALLVAAFSRPLLDRGSLGISVLGSARDVVILLDRSLSMSVGDRWSRATDAVADVAAGLGEADRATLIAYAERAVALTERTNDAGTLRSAAAMLRPGGGRTSAGPAVRLARDILDPSEFPVREVVVISDFQQIGAPGPDEDRLPAGAIVTVVDVSDGTEPANVSVDVVELDRVSSNARDRVTATARLSNRGPAVTTPASVDLVLDGAVVATQRVALPAGETRPVTLTADVPPGRTMVGAVRVAADAYPADDALRFVLEPVDPIAVLVLGDPQAGEDGLYLDRALALAEDPPFEVTSLPIARASAATIGDAEVVVLNDVPYPGGALGRALATFAQAGGGLWVVFGRRHGAESWSAEGVALAGSRPGSLVDRVAAAGGTMSILHYDHPLFAPFAEPRSGDFSSARFFRYRVHDVPEDAVVLARFDDGSVALSERPVGAGRVVAWTAGLANEWNDLPIKPVFLPFVHETIRYLARYQPEPAWRVAGSVLGGADLAAIEGDPVLERPDGRRTRLSDGGPDALILDEPGVYTLRSLGGRGDARAIAVNADPRESDLRRGDPEEIASGMAPIDPGAERRGELAAALTPAEKERRQGLWWYLLLTVLVLSIVEGGLARRAGRVAR